MLVLLVLASFLHVHGETSFSYGNFKNVPKNELFPSGDATISRGALVLTSNKFYSYGRIMRRELIDFCTTPLSFTTDFTFRIERNDTTLHNADGLAFTISPGITAPSGKSYGRWLALVEPEKNGSPSNELVAVEFDTFMNTPSNGYPEFQDIDDNHVGLDLNSIISINSTSLTPYGITLGSGTSIYARIVYDASLQKLKVYVSNDGSFSNPVLEQSVNICAYLGKASYVGFSAGSGSANVDFHKILSWKFSAS